ncbi:hypothetical protein TNIN_475281 [Trichonephila inaurata madagascariensis]|uniref:Uncharacterized protein n=1 Tax=Trichonephila inaurata madagascariensis TaxID=2747483 RepID=A0A8X6JU41_9ARAC|nr:hypothetical protein TNIN_475281 [Trichonephila inaurata madagascariensis]
MKMSKKTICPTIKRIWEPCPLIHFTKGHFTVKIIISIPLNASPSNYTDEDVQENAVDSSRKKNVFRKVKSFFKKLRNDGMELLLEFSCLKTMLTATSNAGSSAAVISSSCIRFQSCI